MRFSLSLKILWYYKVLIIIIINNNFFIDWNVCGMITFSCRTIAHDILWKQHTAATPLGRFMDPGLIPTSTCTICQDHKHIRLSMAQPLWFSVQYRCVRVDLFVCMCVCMHAPRALYEEVSFSLHACVDAWTFSLVLITRKVWWWWWSKVLAELNKAKHFTLEVFLFTLDWDSRSLVSIREVGVIVIPYGEGQWIHS